MVHLALVLISGASVLLLCSGTVHRRDTKRFKAVLVRQRLLPHGVLERVSTSFGSLEIALGATGVLSVVGAPYLPTGVLAVVWLLLGITYAGLAIYQAMVVRRSPGAPCGCFGDETPASPLSVARVGVIAVGIFASVAWVAPSDPAMVALCLTAGTAVGLLLAPRPRAMALEARR